VGPPQGPNAHVWEREASRGEGVSKQSGKLEQMEFKGVLRTSRRAFPTTRRRSEGGPLLPLATSVILAASSTAWSMLSLLPITSTRLEIVPLAIEAATESSTSIKD
jgi:hypothetical protein